MGGKIDASHGLRPLGTVSTHAPEKADKAAKKKPGDADGKGDAKADAKADPKGWKAAQGQQANAHKPAVAHGADPKPLKELTSNLATLKQAAEVPGRFASDLEAARPELVNHPALLRADKAQRLFEFAVPYTQAAVTKSTTPEEKHEVAGELLIRAEQGGYGLLQPRDAQDPFAKNGLAALKEMLEAQTPEQVAERAATHSFDIPSWPSDAAMLAEARAAAQQQPQAMGQSGLVQNPNAPGTFVDQTEEEEQARRDRNSNKRLGGHMLWNVLHLFRDDGEDDRESAKQREAKAQAFLIAGLVFVLLAVIVVAFVSM